MNLVQAFKMAFKSIASKKTRSFLTMLGIIIGVASVVIMVSVVQGQNRKNMEYFEKMGDNKIQVYASLYHNTVGDISQLLYEYCLGMQDLVAGITPNIESSKTMTIKYGAKSFSTDNYEDWAKRISVIAVEKAAKAKPAFSIAADFSSTRKTPPQSKTAPSIIKSKKQIRPSASTKPFGRANDLLTP